MKPSLAGVVSLTRHVCWICGNEHNSLDKWGKCCYGEVEEEMLRAYQTALGQGRVSGKHGCLVCGMRHNAESEAWMCCEGAYTSIRIFIEKGALAEASGCKGCGAKMDPWRKGNDSVCGKCRSKKYRR